MANIEIVFSNAEVNKEIPYNLICQTRYSSIWNTMRRKLIWNAEFSDVERSKAEKIFNQAHNWSVGRGIPETVRMDIFTYNLWDKIATFCMSL